MAATTPATNPVGAPNQRQDSAAIATARATPMSPWIGEDRGEPIARERFQRSREEGVPGRAEEPERHVSIGDREVALECQGSTPRARS